MIVLDTHVLVWWVDGERKKLSRNAVQALRQHAGRNELLVSSVSFFEITTLERRGRLRFNMPRPRGWRMCGDCRNIYSSHRQMTSPSARVSSETPSPAIQRTG